MKVCAIVAEYNPFHNGHKYHIEASRKTTGADCVAVIMSASFVQRGEVSVFSKHERAKSAVLCGADVVFELPAYFSLSSAQRFAQGAVKSLPGIDFLSFGAECADLEALQKAADLIYDEPLSISNKIREKTACGMSYACARAEAMRLSGFNDCAEILSKPNNILAAEYLNAIRSTKIKPVVIERIGVSHDSCTPCENIASATGIRKMLRDKKDILEYVPHIPDEKPLFFEDFEDLILYKLSVCGKEFMNKIPDTSGGLGDRLLSARTNSLDGLLYYAKTKNFTMSRIKRVLMNILIENTLPQGLAPSYLRPLAFNDTGAEYLKKLKDISPIPIVTKPASYKAEDCIWELEMRASKLRSIKSKSKKEDVETSPVKL